MFLPLLLGAGLGAWLGGVTFPTSWELEEGGTYQLLIDGKDRYPTSYVLEYLKKIGFDVKAAAPLSDYRVKIEALWARPTMAIGKKLGRFTLAEVKRKV